MKMKHLETTVISTIDLDYIVWRIEIKDETAVGTDTAAVIEVDGAMMIVNIPIGEEESVTKVMIKMVDKPTGLLCVTLLTIAVDRHIAFSPQIIPRRPVRFSPL
jgi:hypothetical protein